MKKAITVDEITNELLLTWNEELRDCIRFSNPLLRSVGVQVTSQKDVRLNILDETAPPLFPDNPYKPFRGPHFTEIFLTDNIRTVTSTIPVFYSSLEQFENAHFAALHYSAQLETAIQNSLDRAVAGFDGPTFLKITSVTPVFDEANVQIGQYIHVPDSYLLADTHFVGLYSRSRGSIGNQFPNQVIQIQSLGDGFLVPQDVFIEVGGMGEGDFISPLGESFTGFETIFDEKAPVYGIRKKDYSRFTPIIRHYSPILMKEHLLDKIQEHSSNFLYCSPDMFCRLKTLLSTELVRTDNEYSETYCWMNKVIIAENKYFNKNRIYFLNVNDFHFITDSTYTFQLQSIPDAKLISGSGFGLQIGLPGQLFCYNISRQLLAIYDKSEVYDPIYSSRVTIPIDEWLRWGGTIDKGDKNG